MTRNVGRVKETNFLLGTSVYTKSSWLLELEKTDRNNTRTKTRATKAPVPCKTLRGATRYLRRFEPFQGGEAPRGLLEALEYAGDCGEESFHFSPLE